MKRSKIFMAAGALLLTVVGVATTKAHSNKKFAGSMLAKIKINNAAFTLFTGSSVSSDLTASAGNGKTAKINTGSASHTLFTAGLTKQLHYIL